MNPPVIDYTRLAHDYARHRQLHPKVLARLAEAVTLLPSCRVLEIGCGAGNYIAALAALTGCACWGIDPSASMLAQAGQPPADVCFSRGAAEALGFPDNFFDLAFSVDVIHHVQSRPDYFREASRLLRPGGRLCTVTDSEWVIRHRRPLAQYFPESVAVESQRYPSIITLQTLLEQAGFGRFSEQRVEHTYTITDIQPFRDKAFSVLHLISPEAFARGLAWLEQDVRRGPIAGVSRYVLLWGTKPMPL